MVEQHDDLEAHVKSLQDHPRVFSRMIPLIRELDRMKKEARASYESDPYRSMTYEQFYRRIREGLRRFQETGDARLTPPKENPRT